MCEDVRKTLYMLDLENVRWDDLKSQSCEDIYQQGRQALFMVDKMDDSSPWSDEEWEVAADLLPYLYQNAVPIKKGDKNRVSVLKIVNQLSDQLLTHPDQKDLSSQDLDQFIRYIKNGLKTVPDSNDSIHQVKKRAGDIKVEKDFTPGEKRKWIRMVFFFDPQNNEEALQPEELQDMLYHFKNTHTDKMDTVQVNGNPIYELRRAMLLAMKMPSEYQKRLLEKRKVEKEKLMKTQQKVHKELQKSFKELSQEHDTLMSQYRQNPVDEKDVFIQESNRLKKMKDMLDQRMTYSERSMARAKKGKDQAVKLLQNGWKRKWLTKYPSFLQQQEVGLRTCGDNINNCEQRTKTWKKVVEVKDAKIESQKEHIDNLKQEMSRLKLELKAHKDQLSQVNRWEEHGRQRLWKEHTHLNRKLEHLMKELD